MEQLIKTLKPYDPSKYLDYPRILKDYVHRRFGIKL